MTGLPSTGANYVTVLQPSLNPLAERYWQITDVLICDYFSGWGSGGVAGTPNNLSNASIGVAPQVWTVNGWQTGGYFTPFAANGTIRQDLLITGGSSNQPLYHCGELKEDTTAITTDMTVQETPTAQSVRSTREVLTKLDDKVNFTLMEATPLADALRYELPLVNGLPDLGIASYQMARGPFDQLADRTIVLIGVDGDGQLRSEVFPRCCPNKKGKTPFARKENEMLELTYTALEDPITGQVMWVCRDGVNWRALGGAPTLGTVTATPVTGLKVTLSFAISGLDVASLTASSFAATKTTGGVTTALTIPASGSGSPTVSGGIATFTGTGLTASTTYTGQITVTGDNGQTATVAIPSFMSTAS